jgi:UDP-glucose 4-epimerase
MLQQYKLDYLFCDIKKELIMKSPILITGGAGYIGSHIGRLLAQQGYTVIILDSYLHNQSCQMPWAQVYRADMADVTLLEQILVQHEIQIVIHCAALIEVGQSMRDPGNFYETNVAKTITLLRTMIRQGVTKIIFSSSAAVYGIPEQAPIAEDHPCKPINPYGYTKLMAEQIIQDFHRAYGLHYLIFRYFNVAGAWPEENLGEQHSPETHLIPLLFKATSTKQMFNIFGTTYPTKDGTAVRDYIHVRDVAQTHLRAVQHLENRSPSDIFNVGSGQGRSIKEVIDTIQQICRTEISVTYAPTRPGDPPLLVADTTKSQTILQWDPHYSELEFIVQSAYAYHAKQNMAHQISLVTAPI